VDSKTVRIRPLITMKKQYGNRVNTRRIIVVILCALGILTAVTCTIYWLKRIELGQWVTLPDEGDVSTMTASINDLRDALSIEPIEEFEIPSNYVPYILAAFSPAKRYNYDPHHKAYPSIGTIRILTKDGLSVSIVFVEAGQSPMRFSVNECQCTRGGAFGPVEISSQRQDYLDEALELYCVIKAIHEEVSTRRESEWLKTRLERLKTSRGELPPGRW
jgi:hypothetical protein